MDSIQRTIEDTLAAVPSCGYTINACTKISFETEVCRVIKYNKLPVIQSIAWVLKNRHTTLNPMLFGHAIQRILL